MSLSDTFIKTMARSGLGLLLIASIATSARADSVAITSMSTPSGAWYWPGATIGYKFSTSTDINITSLGLWDEGSNGLVASHQVGLFTTTGSLLTSTTVTTASTLSGGFRYEGISSFSLSAGTYVIGAFFAGADDRGAADAVISLSPEITYMQNLYLYGNGFTLPTAEWVGFDAGNIGPNFTYKVAGVPDSGQSLGLLGMGLAALAFFKRRRRA